MVSLAKFGFKLPDLRLAIKFLLIDLSYIELFFTFVKLVNSAGNYLPFQTPLINFFYFISVYLS